MCKDSTSEIIPINQLTDKNQINFSEKMPSVPQKIADKIKNSLNNNAVINSETGETGIAVKGITTPLNTDAEGARNYLLKQPKENFLRIVRVSNILKFPL